MKKVTQLRVEYAHAKLDERRCPGNPLALFRRWFKAAVSAKLLEPNSMVLVTSTRRGIPSGRYVLLKGVESEGFTFFTNYRSRKGKELSKNRNASLLFFWPELERQVRIEGRVENVSTKESDRYFSLRPRSAQLSAWASDQSSTVSSRAELETRVIKMTRRFKGQTIPRPPHWGGYRLSPEKIEFWQGRANRLHDRILYVRRGRRWTLSRLAP